eukprot:TRINITY_DN15165_c0_g3_i7.p1 TRINITY_DN15165_c0_g3~~TRINITY_DN15165_c0_g3_i7.p1  ORF type:complete len:180 (-),score=10.07 TRINITY_DN15165_c0_g3_i7:108-647(-)
MLKQVEEDKAPGDSAQSTDLNSRLLFHKSHASGISKPKKLTKAQILVNNIGLVLRYLSYVIALVQLVYILLAGDKFNFDFVSVMSLIILGLHPLYWLYHLLFVYKACGGKICFYASTTFLTIICASAIGLGHYALYATEDIFQGARVYIFAGNVTAFVFSYFVAAWGICYISVNLAYKK